MSISRREFLKIGSAVASSSLFLALLGCAPKRPDYQNLTSEEISNYVLDKHGIEIPNRISDQYSITEHVETLYGALDRTTPNALLNHEESIEVAKLFDEYNPHSLIQLILPYKSRGQVIYGGSYLGYDWPNYVDRSIPPPDDRFLSMRSAMAIYLPEVATNLDSPISQSWLDEQIKSILDWANVAPVGTEPNLDSSFRPNTNRDHFRRMLIHEIWGHGLWYKIGIAASDNISEYRQSQYTTHVGSNKLDINNPLMRSFAVVNGWKMVPYAEYLEQFGERKKEQVLTKIDTHLANAYIWERDPNIWGRPTNRIVRLNPYADYMGSHEAFAEYMNAFFVAPDLLTDKERRYFTRIHRGLEYDSEAFIQIVAKNPGILLDDPNTLPPFVNQQYNQRVKRYVMANSVSNVAAPV